ncbi:MAG TPA: flagellar hook-associated protein FlgL [Sedimentisphaerales bacterium]|nr:flagellar hook-associated protein FlgL [Sedimentisphaerales bacterium]HRS10873.1 flagellar hook-associated protein FlgL [Sedimentisphaerales bacterium]HRV47578.1 flagellar hook-associated protein FlgL [Sedimentisphaerales bacterium]
MSGSIASICDNVSYALSLHTQAITELQEQASTGNRVNRASDSPSEAYRILGLNTQDRSLAGYIENIQDLIGTLEISSTVIEDMASELANSRTVLTEIVGGVYDNEGQERIAEKLNSTLEQLVSLANTKHANQYLFSGNNTSLPPYAVEYAGGQIVSVTYQGGAEARRIDVAPAVEIEAYRVGDDVFRADQREAPVFLGSTGARNGTGTSNVRGDVWLLVEHDGSNYRISIDEGATFVTVPAGGETNQMVTDSRTGRVLYVDTTQITATGVELVRVPGTYDVFGTLIGLRDLLRNDREISTQQLLSYVDQCVQAVEEVRSLLIQSDVSTGSKVGFLTTLKETLENMQFDTQDETTRLQEADIAQISIDLSRREILYQMSLSVAAKLMGMSLLDYIS